MAWALAAFVVLYAVQGIHSDDFSQAAVNVGFFLVPFAVLAALLARVDWTPRVLGWALAILVAEALLFSVVAFAEYGLRELLWNQTIIEANEIHAHFRVNSLFWDPNIFGRYLAVTIVAVVAVMLWQRATRVVAVAGLVALRPPAGARDDAVAVEPRRAPRGPRRAGGAALERALDRGDLRRASRSRRWSPSPRAARSIPTRRRRSRSTSRPRVAGS